MASLTTSAGALSIQFPYQGKRRTLYLGQAPRRWSEEFCRHVERLLDAREFGEPVPRSTARWLAELAPKWREKLAELGLADVCAVSTIGELTAWCIAKAEVEPATIQKYQACAASLAEFFGPGRVLHAITEGDADEFRRWLAAHGRRAKGAVAESGGALAATTVTGRVKQAKQFFGLAVRKRWLAENPFANLRGGATENRDRMEFIGRETFAKLLAATTDVELRLLLALARYGGLRTPSEPKALRWESVNWAESLLSIYSPKMHRHAHKRIRITPLFPELRPFLAAAFEAAPPGAEYVLGERLRNISSAAIRSRVEKLARRAGVLLWDKAFQNLRSTRETELLDEYPIHVVTAWLGNSPAVAIRHYGQVTKEHLARAVGGSPRDSSPAQPAAGAPATPVAPR